MLNNIMNLLNNLEERELSEENPVGMVDYYEEIDMIAFKSTFFFDLSGLRMSACTLIQVEEGKFVPAIMISSEFDEVNENTQRFFIAHELGHLALHQEVFTNPNYVRDINDEYQADEYAVKLIGLEATIKGLEDYHNYVLNEACDIIAANEAEMRLENLKKLM